MSVSQNLEQQKAMGELQKAIEDIRSEIKVRDDGVGFASIRAVARLCGVSDAALVNSFKSANLKPTKLAQTLIGSGFGGANLESFGREGVPDKAIAVIIEHYAFDAGRYCTQQSRICLRAFTAIGVRAWMQGVTGWVAPQKTRFTKEEIASLCVIGAGTRWEKRFDDGFYEHLSRITGLPLEDKNLRPPRFAQLTNELVYGYLPEGVSAKLRQCREETGGWKRLHQFLSDDGLAVFDQHMDKLFTLMTAAQSVNDLRRMLRRSCSDAYQMQLFKDSRKDGKLVPRKTA